MRLGLLADIHGDGIGFQQALAWFEQQAIELPMEQVCL